MSAPSSSGRCASGDAKVLSTTTMGGSPPGPGFACARAATAAMSTNFSSGLLGVSIQTIRVRGVRAAVEGRQRVGAEVGVAGVDAGRAEHPLEEPVGAAVDVVADDDLFARQHQRGDGRGSRSPAGVGKPVCPTFKDRSRPLQPGTRGVAGAGISPAVVGPADAIVLGECAGLVDGWRHGTGERVGLCAGMDRKGPRAPGRGRARAARSAAPWGLAASAHGTRRGDPHGGVRAVPPVPSVRTSRIAWAGKGSGELVKDPRSDGQPRRRRRSCPLMARWYG